MSKTHDKTESSHDEKQPLRDEAKKKPISSEEVAMRLVKIVGLLTNALKQTAPKTGISMDPAAGLESIGDDDISDGPVKNSVDGHGGMKGVVRIIKMEPERVEALVEDLQRAVQAERMLLLRSTFASLRQASTSGGVKNQLVSLSNLGRLISMFQGEDAVVKQLTAAREAVLSGDPTQYDAASFRVRSAFASQSPDQNTRIAYTTLETQGGEKYQLCPKAVHQIGRAIPMEISKCRDHCIDARLTRDGRVGCAYADWLRVSADNQHLVNRRMDTIRHPDNETNRLRIYEGERGKPEVNESWEAQLEAVRKIVSDKGSDNIEKQLEDASEVDLGHHKDPSERPQEAFASKLDGLRRTLLAGREEGIKMIENDDLVGFARDGGSDKKGPRIDSGIEQPMETQIEPSHDNYADNDDKTIESALQNEFGGLRDDELDILEKQLEGVRHD